MVRKLVLTAVFVFAVGAGVSFAQQTMFESFLDAYSRNPNNESWMFPPGDGMKSADSALTVKLMDARKTAEINAKAEKTVKEEAVRKASDARVKASWKGQKVKIYEAGKDYVLALARLAVIEKMETKEYADLLDRITGKGDLFRIYTLAEKYTEVVDLTSGKLIIFWKFDAVKEKKAVDEADEARNEEFWKEQNQLMSSPIMNK